ncbi:UNVERIFIED_CONTAM: copper amine oxidase-like protein [Acetivibrio alkalicellulosi]
MKKLLIILLVILSLMLSSNLALANEGTSIEISFRVGDDTLSINGNNLKVEKPVVINGVTLVPVRVITEAFGAKVDWDGNTRCVTLDYSQVIIKLYIDNKKAIVDGYEIELLEAPRIINDRTMVPLRFITENFGADVHYDHETKQIKVIKESVNPNSIKDFSLILKRSDKGRIGDSYHNWSIDFPKNLKLDYRNFNGTFNYIVDEDYNYTFFMNTFIKRDDVTLDTIFTNLINKSKDYILIDQGKISSDKKEYVKVVYRDKDLCFEERFYIREDNIFHLSLVSEYDFYRNNREIQRILDSFDLSFVDDGNIEDLSDVTEDGFRHYTDKKFGYSLDVIADWVERKDDDTENRVQFVDTDGNYVFISMYSYEKGMTLQDIFNQNLEYSEKNYNTDIIKYHEVENIELHGSDVIVAPSTVKLHDEVYYGFDFYLKGDNYKYTFGALLTDETYNDENKREKVLDMLYSFKVDEPNFEELGLIIDPNTIQTTHTYRTIKNDKLGWSFQIPSTWEKSSYSNDADDVYYYDDTLSMWFSMDIIDQMDYNEINDMIKGFEKDYGYTIDYIEDVNVKGTRAKKYYVSKKEDSYFIEWGYILNKNNKTYIITFEVSIMRKSKYNIELLEKIWDSLEI